mgnify:CR=1 FL=1
MVEGIEPTARAGHSLTDVGGAFLLMGGVENKQKLSFSIALLCPHPNLKSRYRWISSSGGNCLIHLKTPLLAQVCDHVAVRCSQDEVYIVGGKNADSLSGSILLGELVYSTQCRNPYEFNANIFASFSLSYWARDIFTPRYGHSVCGVLLCLFFPFRALIGPVARMWSHYGSPLPCENHSFFFILFLDGEG